MHDLPAAVRYVDRLGTGSAHDQAALAVIGSADARTVDRLYEDDFTTPSLKCHAAAMLYERWKMTDPARAARFAHDAKEHDAREDTQLFARAPPPARSTRFSPSPPP